MFVKCLKVHRKSVIICPKINSNYFKYFLYTLNISLDLDVHVKKIQNLLILLDLLWGGAVILLAVLTTTLTLDLWKGDWMNKFLLLLGCRQLKLYYKKATVTSNHCQRTQGNFHRVELLHFIPI